MAGLLHFHRCFFLLLFVKVVRSSKDQQATIHIGTPQGNVLNKILPAYIVSQVEHVLARLLDDHSFYERVSYFKGYQQQINRHFQDMERRLKTLEHQRDQSITDIEQLLKKQKESDTRVRNLFTKMTLTQEHLTRVEDKLVSNIETVSRINGSCMEMSEIIDRETDSISGNLRRFNVTHWNDINIVRKEVQEIKTQLRNMTEILETNITSLHLRLEEAERDRVELSQYFIWMGNSLDQKISNISNSCKCVDKSISVPVSVLPTATRKSTDTSATSTLPTATRKSTDTSATSTLPTATRKSTDTSATSTLPTATRKSTDTSATSTLTTATRKSTDTSATSTLPTATRKSTDTSATSTLPTATRKSTDTSATSTLPTATRKSTDTSATSTLPTATRKSTDTSATSTLTTATRKSTDTSATSTLPTATRKSTDTSATSTLTTATRKSTDTSVTSTLPTATRKSTTYSTTIPPQDVEEMNRVFVLRRWGYFARYPQQINIRTGKMSNYSYLQTAGAESVTYDPTSRRIIFSRHDPQGIYSSRLDAKGLKTLKSNVRANGMTVDVGRRLIFMTTCCRRPKRTISRMTTRGKGFRCVLDLTVSGPNEAFDIAIDERQKMIYFCQHDRLVSVNYNGRNIRTLESGGAAFYTVAFDPNRYCIFFNYYNKLMMKSLSTNEKTEIMELNRIIWQMALYNNTLYISHGSGHIVAIHLGRKVNVTLGEMGYGYDVLTLIP